MSTALILMVGVAIGYGLGVFAAFMDWRRGKGPYRR